MTPENQPLIPKADEYIHGLTLQALENIQRPSAALMVRLENSAYEWLQAYAESAGLGIYGEKEWTNQLLNPDGSTLAVEYLIARAALEAFKDIHRSYLIGNPLAALARWRTLWDLSTDAMYICLVNKNDKSETIAHKYLHAMVRDTADVPSARRQTAKLRRTSLAVYNGSLKEDRWTTHNPKQKPVSLERRRAMAEKDHIKNANPNKAEREILKKNKRYLEALRDIANQVVHSASSIFTVQQDLTLVDEDKIMNHSAFCLATCLIALRCSTGKHVPVSNPDALKSPQAMESYQAPNEDTLTSLWRLIIQDITNHQRTVKGYPPEPNYPSQDLAN